jgi:hypothetical protein
MSTKSLILRETEPRIVPKKILGNLRNRSKVLIELERVKGIEPSS